MATTDERLPSLEQQVSAVTAKVDTFIGEMRDRDNQCVAEINELRQRQDVDRKALEDKIDRLGDKIQNIVIAAVVGFGAIVFAAVSALK